MENEKGKKKYWIVGVVLMLVCVGGVYSFFGQKNELTTIIEPVIFSEVFDPPIDPNTESVKHKGVYEKIKKIMGFPVLTPNKLPDQYKLIEVKGSGQSKDQFGYEDVGVVSLNYYKGEENFTILEGTGDVGGLGVGARVLLQDNSIAYFWETITKTGKNYLLLFRGNGEYSYRIYSSTLSKDNLVDIANLIIELQ